MPEKVFDIVFKGQLLSPDPVKVKADFARLFKLSELQVGAIFQASHCVLKKSLSAEKAKLLQRKLASIGILVSIEQHAVDVEDVITLEPEENTPTLPSSVSVDDEPPKAAVGAVEPDVDQSDDLNRDDLRLIDSQAASVSATNYALVEDENNIKHLKFSFSGEGGEYFKIWIVNIFLSIVTLGIYSAWAKVRTHRYFYAHTQLDGSAFEYSANPITILKGRVVAVVFFSVYAFVQVFLPFLAGLFFIVFLSVLPWLVMRSLRFRMRNSAYRGIRFGFDGGLLQAVKAYSLMFFLLPLTLGMLVPYMLFLQRQYLVSNAKYGVDGFSFNVSPVEYYRIYIRAFLAALGLTLLSSIFLTVNPLLGGVAMVAAYVGLMSYLQVELINLMFDSSHLGDHQFSSTMDLADYFKLQMFNLVAIVLTLGLFYPWAKVRVARYRADTLRIMAKGSLDNYVAAQREDIGALGEELGEVFDVDLAF